MATASAAAARTDRDGDRRCAGTGESSDATIAGHCIVRVRAARGTTEGATRDDGGGMASSTVDRNDEARPADATHPAVDAAWIALDAAAIRWALLRGRADGRDGDIDVLVDPADAPALDRVLATVGFARLAAIGHADHRFYRAYDEATDRWLTLDIVTELAFGPGAWLELPGAAQAVLDSRTDAVDGWRLRPDDAFWALLLHDLLDRRDLPPAHGDDLQRLVHEARADGSIGRRIDALAGPGSAWRLIGFIGDGSTEAALSDGRRLGRRWARSTRAKALRRRVRQIVLRRLRKPHTALRRRGIDVAVLGPDGAGKSTLAASLAATLPVPTRTIYLGLYGAGLASAGRLGFIRRVARLWRGWGIGLWHRLRGRVVVYDRHAFDAVLAPARSTAKGRVRRWALLHAIPDPALVLILDAPAELLFARKGEHDVAILDAQRRGYLALAARLRSAEVVDATRDPEAVRRDAVARTWRRLAGGVTRG
jgi:thymidylate kinase